MRACSKLQPVRVCSVSCSPEPFLPILEMSSNWLFNFMGKFTLLKKIHFELEQEVGNEHFCTEQLFFFSEKGENQPGSWPPRQPIKGGSWELSRLLEAWPAGRQAGKKPGRAN